MCDECKWAATCDDDEDSCNAYEPALKTDEEPVELNFDFI